MLEFCLEHYGISSCINFKLSLAKLAQTAQEMYPSGYEYYPKQHMSLSIDQLAVFFNMKHSEYSEYIIMEVFRYAALFGIVSDVLISPKHIEWNFNPYHQRDLFFTKLRLDTRESKKHSSAV